MCNTGVSSAAIVLVLFILLIIILGAYLKALERSNYGLQ